MKRGIADILCHESWLREVREVTVRDLVNWDIETYPDVIGIKEIAEESYPFEIPEYEGEFLDLWDCELFSEEKAVILFNETTDDVITGLNRKVKIGWLLQ